MLKFKNCDKFKKVKILIVKLQVILKSALIFNFNFFELNIFNFNEATIVTKIHSINRNENLIIQ